jgi:peptide/nickel transport system permease protein
VIQIPTETESEGHQPPSRQGGLQRVRRALGYLRKDKGALAGAIVVFAFFFTAVSVAIANFLGVRITPYNPLQINVGPTLASPSLAHLFGVDQLGRDVFSRMVAATPSDFQICVVVVAFSLVIGIPLGSFAAYRGGLVDEGLMRLTDIFFALPALILAMAISVALGTGTTNMMIALMIIWWPPYARLARGETLKIMHQNYVEAARLSGAGRLRTLFDHVIPNIFTTMLVYATLDIGAVILVYSGLSYVGLGVQPPYSDWGQMVSSSQDYALSAPWLPLFPGLIIALVVIGFSLLGDGIKDALGVS